MAASLEPHDRDSLLAQLEIKVERELGYLNITIIWITNMEVLLCVMCHKKALLSAMNIRFISSTMIYLSLPLVASQDPFPPPIL